MSSGEFVLMPWCSNVSYGVCSGSAGLCLCLACVLLHLMSGSTIMVAPGSGVLVLDCIVNMQAHHWQVCQTAPSRPAEAGDVAILG